MIVTLLIVGMAVLIWEASDKYECINVMGYTYGIRK